MYKRKDTKKQMVVRAIQRKPHTVPILPARAGKSENSRKEARNLFNRKVTQRNKVSSNSRVAVSTLARTATASTKIRKWDAWPPIRRPSLGGTDDKLAREISATSENDKNFPHSVN
jgi:hypothetical protein